MADTVSTELPSQDELAQIGEIRDRCRAEIDALSCQSDDVVGDLRVCRFLRAKGGDVRAATAWFKEFLNWRVTSNIDVERREVIGRSPQDFRAWFMKRRNPYFPVCPYVGRNPDGHVIWYIRQGLLDAKKWAEHRQVSMDEDMRIMNLVMEWTLWHLDVLSREEGRMCFVIKVGDFRGLGQEGRPIPIFVPEFKAQVMGMLKSWQVYYCEHDSLLVMINTAWAFRAMFQVMQLMLTARQKSKIRILGDASQPEVLAKLRAIMPDDLRPEEYGGYLTYAPGVIPRPSAEEVEQWYRERHLVRPDYPPEASGEAAAEAVSQADVRVDVSAGAGK